MTDVSIIIPVYNGRHFVAACLDTLEKTTEDSGVSIQVIVVDDGSGADTSSFLANYATRSQFSDFKLVTNKMNMGFAATCNRGASAANGNVLVLLNSDTVPEPGWLRPLIAPVASGEAAISGSLLLYPDGSIQHAGVEFTNHLEPVHRFAHLHPEQVEDLTQPVYLQAVTGACMAVSSDAWSKTGGLHEGYMNGLEDIDLCLEVRKAGLEVIFVPDSVLVHHESVSAGRFDHARENIDLFNRRQRSCCFSDADISLRSKIAKWHQHMQVDIPYIYSQLVTPELLAYSEIVSRGIENVAHETKEQDELFLVPDFVDESRPVIGVSAYLPPIMIRDLVCSLSVISDVTVAICCAKEDQPDVALLLDNLLEDPLVEFVPPDLTLAELPVKPEEIIRAMTDFSEAIACMTIDDLVTVVNNKRIPFTAYKSFHSQSRKPTSLNAMRAVIER